MMADELTDGSGSSGSISGRFAGAAAYALILALGIGGFLLVRAIGESWSRNDAAASVVTEVGTDVEAEAASAAKKPKSVDVVFHVLATLAAVILLGYLLGQVLKRVGQPPVIGEILAGIALGPSLLGWLWPEGMHWLIPAGADDPHGHVTAALKAISQLGVLLYMFVVGLDLNAAKLRHEAHSTVAISHVSIVLPFLLGAILALWLFQDYSPDGVSFTSFALFMGVAMSITAFPVLARILTDRGMEKTRIGSIALACAAADDVTAWCLLALVVGILQAQIGNFFFVATGSVAFIAAMFLVVRPMAEAWNAKLERRAGGRLPAGSLVIVLVAALLCALATESIGIHAIFGAFLLGVVIPHDGRLATEIKVRLRDMVTILLLPAFFAYTGMRTQIGLVSGWEAWLACGAVILVATAGKFGGTVAAARATGIGWRDAAALGTLMNTRGLMELIVLNIGLDLGVISPTLFAMMVLMALATTMATSPIVTWLLAAEPKPVPAA